uniref:Fibronectin type-III domain-containing protein n=1 Tax=Leptobrachium leishanense TaxID=445787 RepID=A0A8C5PCY1_9ANUR
MERLCSGRAGHHLILLLFVAALLPGLGLSGQQSLEPPSNVSVHGAGGHFTLTWDLNNFVNDGKLNVTFSAFFQKFGRLPRKKWKAVPGCLHITQRFCDLDLKPYFNYNLRVRSEFPKLSLWSTRIPFSPIAAALSRPPDVSVNLSDAGVLVTISDPSRSAPLSVDVDLAYDLTLWDVNTGATRSLVFSDPEFLLGDLVSGVRYCLKARLTDLAMKTMSPYSEAQCFQTKGTFKNVRILAFDTTFLLKWDWDYEQQPNVTFTAQRISKGMSWRVFDSCENINKTECDMSAELYMFTSYQLRVIAQDGQGNKNFSDSINFLPKSDTVIGPPTSLTVKVMNGALNIMAREPSVLSMPDVSLDCVPAFQLKRWKNSSDHQEEYRGDSSFFTVEHVEPSTEYCLKMRVVCKRNRTGLYSETVCITTDPDPWVFWKSWGILVILVILVIVSVLVYACVCPFQRYMKHIFYPSSKLPSSIEKGIPDSKFFNNLLLQEEEELVTDVCLVIRDDPDQFDNYVKTSGESFRDSGNYSNEEETTANSELSTQCLVQQRSSLQIFTAYCWMNSQSGRSET